MTVDVKVRTKQARPTPAHNGWLWDFLVVPDGDDLRITMSVKDMHTNKCEAEVVIKGASKEVKLGVITANFYDLSNCLIPHFDKETCTAKVVGFPKRPKKWNDIAIRFEGQITGNFYLRKDWLHANQ